MSLVVNASGSGRDLGRAHGEAARPQIAAALAAWEGATLAGGHHRSALDYASALVGQTCLIKAMALHTPDLHEEIEGIAEGSAQPFDLIAAYNLMDEQWWFDLGSIGTDRGCSVVGFVESGRTLLSQNMDLPKFMDGSQVILHLRPVDGAEQIILTSAGLIGLTGASAVGMGICVNALLMLNSNRAGLPVAAALRHALGQPNRSVAVAALNSVPHASGQHYAIAGRDGISSLECSASGCADVDFSGPVLRHTNHPLASSDEHPAQRARLEASGSITNSLERLAYLETLDAGPGHAAQVRTWLDTPDTPICVTPGDRGPGFTFGSIVIEIAETTTVTIRPSFPGETRWQAFTL